MDTECLNYFFISNKVTRANKLTKSSSIQACIWVSDHLCCKHTVFLFHDTLSQSLCHTFLIPLATLAFPSQLLPYLNTFQVFFFFPPPLPLLCCLSTFLVCQLGKRFFLGLVLSRGDVLLQLACQRFVLWCPH